MNNVFVVEGVDFCGKGTQLDMLSKHIPTAIRLREPGGTEAGEGIRKIFLDAKSGEGLDNITRTLLLFAARKQLVDQHILPAVASNSSEYPPILLDRFFFSTFAYQWSDMEKREDRELVEHLTRITVPQQVLDSILVFQLVIPYQTYLDRLNQREERNHMDYWNEQDFHRIQRSFHAPVDLGFIKPTQYCVFDGQQHPEMIQEHIRYAMTVPEKYSYEEQEYLLHMS